MPGPGAAGKPAAAAHRGLDVGWLAACLGLIAAATALGHPDGTRRLAKRSRARLSGLLQAAGREG